MNSQTASPEIHWQDKPHHHDSKASSRQAHETHSTQNHTPPQNSETQRSQPLSLFMVRHGH